MTFSHVSRPLLANTVALQRFLMTSSHVLSPPSPLVRLRHQRPSPGLSVGRSLIGRAAFGIPRRLRRSHIFARDGAAYTRTAYLPDG